MATINGDLKVSGTNKTLKDIASSGGDFLPLTGGTITGDLRLKDNLDYGRKINFGDGEYAYISEPEDDVLELYGRKGVIFDVYDTSEKIIGKWIDGKYIYRKVIYHYGDEASVGVDTGISDMDWLIDAYGVAKMTGDNIFLPLNFYNGNGWNTFHVTSSGNVIQFQRASNNYHTLYWYIILEYTKK